MKGWTKWCLPSFPEEKKKKKNFLARLRKKTQINEIKNFPTKKAQDQISFIGKTCLTFK